MLLQNYLFSNSKGVVKMARVSQMQGIPAHLTYLKTNDKRRHPAHCIFADGKGKLRICTSPQSEKYMESCHSARNCEHYEEQ